MNVPQPLLNSGAWAFCQVESMMLTPSQCVGREVKHQVSMGAKT